MISISVFNYPNLHVIDGSIIPANLGVNPSLTITAMAEHAMSQLPNKEARTDNTYKEAFPEITPSFEPENNKITTKKKALALGAFSALAISTIVYFVVKNKKK